MNLTLIKTTALTTMHKGAFILKKYSPEILTAVGIVTSVAATVSCGIATGNHLEEVLDTHSSNMWALEDDGDLTDKQKKAGKTKIYLSTIGNIAKIYAPTAILQGVSVACSFGSHKILKDRNVALMAAYTGLSTAYNNYRSRVIEEFGEEKDLKYRAGVVDKVETETVETKGGKTKELEKVLSIQDVSKNASPYARCFDETNENWHGSADLNLLFLRNMENWLNDKLHIQGHVFLNEVYEALGFEHTTAGAVVGWIFDKNDPTRQNYIDFNIYNLLDPTKRLFINGYEAAVWLDFNVDGLIYDKI